MEEKNVNKVDENLNNIEKLEIRIKELEKENNELKEFKNIYLLKIADYENIKKRLEKEKLLAIEYANEQIVKDLLFQIDNLNLAIQSLLNLDISENEKEGLNFVMKGFVNMLARHNIEEISCEKFDPNFHEVISFEKSEKKNNEDIIQVLQKGFRFKNKIIRPAKVCICKND